MSERPRKPSPESQEPAAPSPESTTSLLREAAEISEPSRSAVDAALARSSRASSPARFQGEIIAKRYRLDHELGRGGMGFVWAATHSVTRKRVAIKFLIASADPRTDLRRRFLREAQAASAVNHPNVVEVMDVFELEDETPVIVMELLEGASVEAVWKACRGRINLRAASSIIDQLLDALVAAHDKNIVHRDIKPANLFVTREGIVKVLDFGIARARDAAVGGLEAGSATGTGVLLGTPAFMAPEQARGRANDIDGQTDVWAVGATFFTILTGEFVHQSDNPRELLIRAATEPARRLQSVGKGVPAPISQVVDRALAFEKRARWASARSMREALNNACRQSFGTPVQRIKLESIVFDSGGAADKARADYGKGAHAVTPKDLAGARTDRPVSMKERRSASRQRRLAGAGLLTTAGALVAIVGVVAGMHSYKSSKKATDQPSAAARIQAPGPAPSVEPLVPSAAGTLESVPARVERTDSPQVASTNLSPSAFSAAPKASPRPITPTPIKTVGTSPSPTTLASAGTRATASAVPTANCNPPFYFDPQGTRIFKKECL
jgi:serine/threonine protein kinase